jgi:hypothetical protein
MLIKLNRLLAIATTEGGALKLQAGSQNPTVNDYDRDCHDYSYASGLVWPGWNDSGKAVQFTFKHGYTEARIENPSGKGLQLAFIQKAAENRCQQFWKYSGQFKLGPREPRLSFTGPRYLQITLDELILVQ